MRVRYRKNLICCSQVASEGKSCSSLPVLNKICSKVSEQNVDMPIGGCMYAQLKMKNVINTF